MSDSNLSYKQINDSVGTGIDLCMLGDRRLFIKRLRSLLQRFKQKKTIDKSLEKLQRDIEQSYQRVLKRQKNLPTITYPDDLPIADKRETIIAAIKQSQVVIIAGETGSGKTTQLPKICLELGRGISALIGHTQPRRLAARTVANRIAEELHTPLGDKVGYQVRFTDHSGDNTYIKLMTDGILLAEIQNDRYLSRYDTLIIDEAHERSLNIDFILGYLKQILPRRPDLKVIITSATIDVERFSKHFDDAPVIQVSGRTYPVEMLYRPPLDSDEDIYTAIVSAAEEILAMPKRGDILVFLSGEREIRETATSLRRAELRDIEVLPLYARLSVKEQTRIFQPHRGMRIILATNVAETSITVPGIRYVIDSGYARISRYSYRTKVQRLPIEAISQASANQRAGRCGRVSDGICIRLYSEEDFNTRPEFTDPEIVRTNLASVILQMLRMRIGDVRDFPFVEPPDQRLINDGFQLLTELGAVNKHNALLPLGTQLSRLPLDPRLGKMLVTASTEGALNELLIITAALSIQDPRERPADKRQAADEKHRQWKDPQSDFISLLNLWNHFEEQRQELSRNKFSRYCHSNFVSYLRMREWRDLLHQLHLACRDLKLPENHQPASTDSIHRALLSGLLSQIGFREQEREFAGARNRKFHIFPGSGLAKKPPKWVVSAELLETSRLYAHNVAAINPDWLPSMAAHLVRKQHSEPYYDVRRGQVMAYERQTLYGLTIIDRKRVGFANIDPVLSRQVFIQGALVENRYRGKGKFFKHNQKLIRDLEELENRLRQRDIVIDDRAIFNFYEQRIPVDIVSLASLEQWRKEKEKSNPKILYLDRSTLVSQDAVGDAESQFPKQIEWQGAVYRLSYRFEPGDKSDGVSVHIPVPVLHQVPAYLFEWLVPGLLRDKCIALVKALPKQTRKQFVPVPDYVDKALTAMAPQNKALGVVLGQQLKRHTGIAISTDVWRENTLDDFYRISYRLEDENRKFVDQGKDLLELKARYKVTIQAAIHEAAATLDEQTGLSRWSFGSLDKKALLSKGKLEIEAFPALVDEGQSVAVRLLDNAADAKIESIKGIVRLLLLSNPETAKYLRKELLKKRQLPLVASGLGDQKQLVEDIIHAAYKISCLEGKPMPRTDTAFDVCLKEGKAKITGQALEMEKMVVALLEPLKQVNRLIIKHQKTYKFSVADVQRQLAYLFRRGFLFETSGYWLKQYPRYIKALVLRLERLPGQIEKDQDFVKETQLLLSDLELFIADKKPVLEDCLPELEKNRFMIEEYSVSTFAQVLKTVVPVSAKRIRNHLDKIKHSLP